MFQWTRQCQWVGHKWGLASWPIGERWCARCGARFSSTLRKPWRCQRGWHDVELNRCVRCGDNLGVRA